MKRVEGNEGVIQDGKRLRLTAAWLRYKLWSGFCTRIKRQAERKRAMKCDAGRRRDELDIDRTVGKI